MPISNSVQNKVVDSIIASEGGFVNDPHDHGGATNYGITLATLRMQPGYEAATATTVKSLSVEVARAIYHNIYVVPYLKLGNDIIFNFCVNAAVQHGISGANKIIQTALGITADGILGRESQGKLLCAEASPTQFLATLVAARCRYYTAIVKRNPGQIKFLAGWVNRIAADLS